MSNTWPFKEGSANWPFSETLNWPFDTVENFPFGGSENFPFSGGGSFDFSAHGELVFLPGSDTLWQTNAEITLADATNDPVSRYVPAIMPAGALYALDATTPWGSYQAPDDGINGNGVLEMVLGTHALNMQKDDGEGSPTGFTAADIFTSDNALIWACGKAVGTPSSGARQMFGDLNKQSFTIHRQSDGDVAAFWQETSTAESFLVTPDAGDLYSIIAWKHGTVVDWWANGVKQTQRTGVGGWFAGTGQIGVYGGVNSTGLHVEHQLLVGGMGAAAGYTEELAVALAARLETLLGRDS